MVIDKEFDEFADSLLNVAVALRPYLIEAESPNKMVYVPAPCVEGELTIKELLDFMETQIEYVKTKIVPYDYTVGYRDALKTLCQYIRRRTEEDSKKKEETNANCC